MRWWRQHVDSKVLACDGVRGSMMVAFFSSVPEVGTPHQSSFVVWFLALSLEA